MRRVYSEAKRIQKGGATEPDLAVIAWMPGGKDDEASALPGLIYKRMGDEHQWIPRGYDSESEVIREAIEVFDDSESELQAQYQMEEADGQNDHRDSG